MRGFNLGLGVSRDSCTTLSSIVRFPRVPTSVCMAMDKFPGAQNFSVSPKKPLESAGYRKVFSMTLPLVTASLSLGHFAAGEMIVGIGL
jgi:hypothetical protein